MTKNEVLNKLSKNEIDYKEAYKMLYPNIKQKKARKAHFVKLSVKVPDSNAANFFIRLLFILPIPIWLVKLIVGRRLNRYVSDDIPISFRDLITLAAVKGTYVKVIANDNTKVLIKTI